ncbi:hypothetical protein EVAR_39760_1 [Eumeta japonica]|uniref:Nucleic-acid-binding protein from transposon X-element n=1 Tax=Eumeta variegata TaxID=151549 RepID=A0A4C1X6R9_EUMVA|nr:hypothetical protein EVAR_39760_1 [Eumeta japonica]
MPVQWHRCQLYGHATANCYAQPRCVKCLVPHWTRDCDRNKESGGEPSCYNCGQNCTTIYGGENKLSVSTGERQPPYRKTKHGVDRLRIILDNQELIAD